MLSHTLEETLQHAFLYARARRHTYATLEHLLLALIQDPDAGPLLGNVCSDVPALQRVLTEHLDGQVELCGSLNDEEEVQLTIAFNRVLQRAALYVQSAHQASDSSAKVTGNNVLISMFSEQESYAVYFLHRSRVTREAVLAHTSEATSDQAPSSAYFINLSERVGDLDPLIGREREMTRILQILGRRMRHNPLLVGEPGVGKTALVEGLVRCIVRGEVPDHLKGCTVYALDLGAVLAGTRYRGDFEERMGTVLRQITQEKALLFIDEIHTLVGAGSTTGGAVDASHMLKPLLARGHLRCIGATTHRDFQNSFSKDRAFARRFQNVSVDEPSEEDSLRILIGLKGLYEAHHNVHYTRHAVRAAVSLSKRYMTERHLPDKALDVLDEAGSYRSMNKGRTVRTKEIAQTVAQITSMPVQHVSTSDREALRTLESDLKAVVFGQDSAVEALSTSIKVARAGLRSPEKPIGCYVFSGPTGVGKTEIARQLALRLSLPLHRFDMSEYMEKHSVSRLLGAPPGYVGFEQASLLEDTIRRTPHCVMLLDEIEKAHHDIFHVLLQVMDYGRLTDSQGRAVDFRHVILIMTTNAGSALKHSVGFMAPEKEMESSLAFLRPEFLNRLDAHIRFSPLSKAHVGYIVDKFIGELNGRLKKHSLRLILSARARSWLCERGYDPLYGARPLSRLIQETLEKPLSEALLFEGRASKTVRVSVKGEGLSLTFSSKGER